MNTKALAYFCPTDSDEEKNALNKGTPRTYNIKLFSDLTEHPDKQDR
jgi:hypothetical protein